MLVYSELFLFFIALCMACLVCGVYLGAIIAVCNDYEWEIRTPLIRWRGDRSEEDEGKDEESNVPG